MPSARSHIGEIRKLTERLNGQEALKHYLMLACTAAGIGLWRWRMSDDYLFWDDRMVELWGAASNDVTFQTFEGALDPHDRARVLAAVRSCVDQHGDYDTVFRIQKIDDGSTRLIHARGHVLAPANEWMAGICMDVTNRAHACERADCPCRITPG